MTTESPTPTFQQETTVFMSTAGMPGRFQSNFDFQLALALGSADHGGSATGECFATISKIEDGDLKGWHTAWAETARRVEGIATECIAGGHQVSASEAFLRASTYWRSAGFFLERSDETRIPTWKKNRHCFRNGMDLSGILCETVNKRHNGSIVINTALTH